MKKLMIGLAAAGLCGAVFADVSSQNVVGYAATPNEAEEVQTFIGASFFKTGGSDEVLPINDLQCVEGFEYGDQLQTSFIDDSGLIDFVAYEYDDFEGGWCLEGDLIDDSVVLALGQGAWFVTSDAKHLQSAGTVKATNKVRTLTEVQQVVCSLYPVPFCPNGPNVSWNVDENAGAQIQTSFITDEGLIDFIAYEYDSFEGGWCLEGDLLDPDFAVAQPGEGFWLVFGDSFAECDFTETSPLYVE